MTSQKTHEVRVHAQGRVVIPAELRQSMDLKEGDQLVARLERGRLVLERRADILQRLRDLFQISGNGGGRDQRDSRVVIPGYE